MGSTKSNDLIESLKPGNFSGSQPRKPRIFWDDIRHIRTETWIFTGLHNQFLLHRDQFVILLCVSELYGSPMEASGNTPDWENQLTQKYEAHFYFSAHGPTSSIHGCCVLLLPGFLRLMWGKKQPAATLSRKMAWLWSSINFSASSFCSSNLGPTISPPKDRQLGQDAFWHRSPTLPAETPIFHGTPKKTTMFRQKKTTQRFRTVQVLDPSPAWGSVLHFVRLDQGLCTGEQVSHLTGKNGGKNGGLTTSKSHSFVLLDHPTQFFLTENLKLSMVPLCPKAKVKRCRCPPQKWYWNHRPFETRCWNNQLWSWGAVDLP